MYYTSLMWMLAHTALSPAPAAHIIIHPCTAPGMMMSAHLIHLADTLFAADLTIMEEGAELLSRLQARLESRALPSEQLPMFTSCCSGWVAMVEKSNPELIPFLSTCKSPQMMLGAVIKNYFAAEVGVSAADICNVSIMPCVRKQGEADREWFDTTGVCVCVCSF